MCFFGDQSKRGPLTTSSERGRIGTGCRGGCHRLHHLCGGGRRLFETSSAGFLICKIGTGIPYLAEVLRRLISICRALRKTKHKAELQPGREAAPGSAARPAPWRGLQGSSRQCGWSSRSASHGGDCSDQGRRPKGCDSARGQTHHLQSQEPRGAEAVHARHPPGHASLTKSPSSSPSAIL